MEPESLQKRLDPELIHLSGDPVQGSATATKNSSPFNVYVDAYTKQRDPCRANLFPLLSRDALLL